MEGWIIIFLFDETESTVLECAGIVKILEWINMQILIDLLYSMITEYFNFSSFTKITKIYFKIINDQEIHSTMKFYYNFPFSCLSFLFLVVITICLQSWRLDP